MWALPEQLLAAIVDALHVANWQRSGDKKVPRPKQLPRPGVTDDSVRRIGKARPIAEIDALLRR